MTYCKYCEKECKNNNSLKQHEIRCKKNPDKIEFVSGFIKYNIDVKSGIKNSSNQYIKSKELGLEKPNYPNKKKYKWKFPMSEERRNKISIEKKKFFEDNPEKLPFRLNHSSKESWLEKTFREKLDSENITDYIQEYIFSRYSFDFAFEKYMLAIELDGGTHNFERVKKIDFAKDSLAKEYNWHIIRFTGEEIRNNLSWCISIIKNYMNTTIVIENKIKTPKEKRLLENEIKKKEKISIIEKENKRKIEILINSNIDFNKIGWINEASKILNISRRIVRKLINDNELKVYTRKKRGPEAIRTLM